MRIGFSSARKEIHMESSEPRVYVRLNFDDTGPARRQPIAAWGGVSGLLEGLTNIHSESRCRECRVRRPVLTD